MLNSVWIGLIAFWENEKSIKRSKTNSKNKKSDRGGLGIAKHTCGSMPYVRRREEMRDKVTGELPDMVTFMEATHMVKETMTMVTLWTLTILHKKKLMPFTKGSSEERQEIWLWFNSGS
ncbi:unnamed protein product [Arabidopsis lyrata]|nr:unnamed protein product [Arabidopsis lyrata]